MVAIDMEMPKNCHACELTYHDEAMNRRCSKTKHVVELNFNERADDCPLVVTEELKEGKWEETRYRSYDPQSCETYDDGIGFRCSNCSNVFKVTSLARYHYCPNCGCKMSVIPTGSV